MEPLHIGAFLPLTKKLNTPAPEPAVRPFGTPTSESRAEEHLRRSFEIDPLQSEIAYELGRMGVVVQTPRKRAVNTGKLDKMLDEQKKKNDSLSE